MIINRCVVPLLCLFIGLSLPACGKSFAPTFTPDVGERRTIEQNDYITISVEVMGQSMPMNMSNTSAWIAEVTNVDSQNGDVTMQVTVDRFRMDMGLDMLQGMPGLGFDTAALQRAQDAMKGKSFTVTVSPGGEVRRLEGASAFAEGIDLPAGPAGAGMREMIEGMFGEQMLSKQVEAWMAPHQPIEVRPGSRWSKRGEYDMGMMGLGYNQTFTLNSVEAGVAKIAFETQFEPSTGGGGGGGSPLGDIGFNIRPEGTATGTIEMDANSGWVNKMYTDYNVNAAMSIEGMPAADMSMNMRMTGNSSIEMR